MVRGRKETINMLMNIDNYFGEHKGRLAPVIMFLIAASAPVLIYPILFPTLPLLSIMIGLEVVWATRMAMIILGRERERLAQYIAQNNDEYVGAKDLIRIAHVHDDGLIEYMNGRVSYIISCFSMSYSNDDAFSIDFENFLEKLKGYDFDIYCHEVVDEFKLQNNLDRVKVYTDRTIMQERMMFYMKQDEYCKDNSKLYRFNIVVKTYKSSWKELRARLESIIRSETSNVFKDIYICNTPEKCSDVISRDLCTNVELERMLVDKFQNDNYYGSKVLYYGEDIPEELKPKKDKVELEKRRVSFEDTDVN